MMAPDTREGKASTHAVGPGLMSSCYHFPHPHAQRLLGLGGLWRDLQGWGERERGGGVCPASPGGAVPTPRRNQVPSAGQDSDPQILPIQAQQSLQLEIGHPSSKNSLDFPSSSGVSPRGQSVPSSPGSCFSPRREDAPLLSTFLGLELPPKNIHTYLSPGEVQ